uniref:Myotubularin phosphatase domain-containing protein n=2 Tax=Octactis speculum TaxID=3111310 RepID=A0A7S2AUR2_9STRA
MEKDFHSFGHPFQLRLAHGESSADRVNEQLSPIFIQFLDAAWQIVTQFPYMFEFNTRYLLCIAEHVASCRFGTFLFNTEKERLEEDIENKTVSLWSYLRLNRKYFLNLTYKRSNGLPQIIDSQDDVILPPLPVLLRGVTLWSDYFLRWSPSPSFTHHAFTPRALKRLGTLGGTEQYDEHDIFDTSRCSVADLQLPEAFCKSSEAEAMVLEVMVEAEKWRVKALQEKMRSVFEVSEPSQPSFASSDVVTDATQTVTMEGPPITIGESPSS